MKTRAANVAALDDGWTRKLILLCALALFLTAYYTTPLSKHVAIKLTAWSYATTISMSMDAARMAGRLSEQQG